MKTFKLIFLLFAALLAASSPAISISKRLTPVTQVLSTGTTAIGATTLTVGSTTGFPANGMLLVIPNGSTTAMQLVYTGTTGTSFTGIPASGILSVTASIGANSTVALLLNVSQRQDGHYRSYISPAYYGAIGDGSTDDTAALQAAINISIATSVPLSLAAGNYKFTSGLTASLGNSQAIKVIGNSQNSTTLTFTGTGDALHIIQVGTSNGRFAGVLQDFTLSGSVAYGANTGQCGITIDNVPNLNVSRITCTNFDIGIRTINNCYGCDFSNLTTFATTCNVGLYLVGQDVNNVAGSGSDITVYNPWISGKRAAIWLGGNQGGFHIYGGQIPCGQFGGGITTASASIMAGPTYDGLPDTALNGAVTAGATSFTVTNGARLFSGGGYVWINGQVVEYTSSAGNVFSGVPASGFGSIASNLASGTPVCIIGAVSSVQIYGSSFEGTSQNPCVTVLGGNGWDFNGCNFNSNHTATCVLYTPFQGIQAIMQNCGAIGTFSGTTLISDTDATGGDSITEIGSFGGGLVNTSTSFTLSGTYGMCAQSLIPNKLYSQTFTQNFASNVTATVGCNYFLATASGFTVTLQPSASMIGQDVTLSIFFTGSGTASVTPASGDTLDRGTSAETLTQTSGPCSLVLTATPYGWRTRSKLQS